MNTDKNTKMNAFTAKYAKEMNTFENALNAAKALNNEPLKQLVLLAEGSRKKLGVSPDAWAELSEKLVEVLQADEKDAKVWCEGATEGINEVLEEEEKLDALQERRRVCREKNANTAEFLAVRKTANSDVVQISSLTAEEMKTAKEALKGRQYRHIKTSGWLNAPALHPKNFGDKEKHIRHFQYSIEGHIQAEFNYGTAEIGRGDRGIDYCEEMVKESLIASGYKMDDVLCFQINNNDDCFLFKVCDFNLIAKDAVNKMPIKCFIYGCKPTEVRFLGRRLYGICFTDPNVDKTGLTIHPPCLFSEMVADEKNGGMFALDTNTYWFFDEEAADAFGKAVMGAVFVICPYCSKFFEEKYCEKLTCALANVLPNNYQNKRGDTSNFYCGDCVLIGKNRLKAEEEAKKSRAENAARLAEPARATAEAQLLKMLEDKETIVASKPAKAETSKERNKRLAAEAAKELKAEKKRKDDYLKQSGLYKTPEQIKKERDAAFKVQCDAHKNGSGGKRR